VGLDFKRPPHRYWGLAFGSRHTRGTGDAALTLSFIVGLHTAGIFFHKERTMDRWRDIWDFFTYSWASPYAPAFLYSDAPSNPNTIQPCKILMFASDEIMISLLISCSLPFTYCRHIILVIPNCLLPWTRCLVGRSHMFSAF
jgi:hypothetical protein